jgi:hypothetical protein
MPRHQRWGVAAKVTYPALAGMSMSRLLISLPYPHLYILSYPSANIPSTTQNNRENPSPASSSLIALTPAHGTRNNVQPDPNPFPSPHPGFPRQRYRFRISPSIVSRKITLHPSLIPISRRLRPRQASFASHPPPASPYTRFIA